MADAYYTPPAPVWKAQRRLRAQWQGVADAIPGFDGPAAAGRSCAGHPHRAGERVFIELTQQAIKVWCRDILADPRMKAGILAEPVSHVLAAVEYRQVDAAEREYWDRINKRRGRQEKQFRLARELAQGRARIDGRLARASALPPSSVLQNPGKCRWSA